MREFIKLISNIGTTAEHTPSERRNIHMVNQFSAAAIFFSILFLFVNLYSGGYDTIIPSLSAIILFSIIPFANYRKKYILAKQLFAGIGLFATTVAVGVSELHTNIYYYYSMVFALMLVFFPEKNI